MEGGFEQVLDEVKEFPSSIRTLSGTPGAATFSREAPDIVHVQKILGHRLIPTTV
jgi:hypothetical protein